LRHAPIDKGRTPPYVSATFAGPPRRTIGRALQQPKMLVKMGDWGRSFIRRGLRVSRE